MKHALRLLRNREGATIIELAFAFPVLILFIWSIYQFGLIFRANSGIQHSLGEGARFATLWPKPSDALIREKMRKAVYGIGPGNFTIKNPVAGAGFIDLEVTYTQQTNLLLLPGPTVNITKKKKVWIAS